MPIFVGVAWCRKGWLVIRIYESDTGAPVTGLTCPFIEVLNLSVGCSL
jgi:hypothetical protein